MLAKRLLTAAASRLDEGGLWTPAAITTALWLDAADSSTITLNGSTVSEWRDKSGNNRHATQSTAANQPTKMTNGVQFDGVADRMTLATQPITGTTPRTFFVVASPTNLSAPAVFSAVEVTTSPGRLWDICLESGQIAIRVTNNAIYATTISTTSPGIFGVAWSSGAVFSTDVRHNGATITRTGGIDATINTTTGTARIGYAEGQTKFFAGTISEMLIIPVFLSIADRQRIEGYLAHKWGLAASLPSDHPYKTAAPTV